MATPTANQGIPIPDPTDADNVPFGISQAVATIEPRLVMRFTSTTNRDTILTSPVAGMIAYVGSGRLTYYTGSAWIDLNDYSLPAKQETNGPVSNAATGAATTWANLTTNVTASLTLAAPALVLVEYGAWLAVGGAAEGEQETVTEPVGFSPGWECGRPSTRRDEREEKTTNTTRPSGSCQALHPCPP